MDIKVTVSSKYLEDKVDSSSIISTYTAREIALFGGRDLGEVLSRMPGFEEFGTLVNGRNIVTIRADKPSSNNNHVLFLLDGIPLNRDSYTGGIWTEATLLSVPLDIIEQLEVIRGPGSVLYGTNAYAGVVNIVTKSSDKLQSKVSFSKGNFGTSYVQASLSGDVNGWQLTSSLRLFESEGWPYETNDASGGNFQDNLASSSPGIITTVRKDNFSANIYWGKAKQETIRGNTNFQEAASTDNEKYMLDIGYKIDIYKDWLLTSHFSHVGGRTKHKVSGVSPGQLRQINYQSNDSRLEINVKKEFANNNKLIVGSTFDLFKGSNPPPIIIVPDWNYYLFGVYGQYDIITENTKYTIGAQYNKAEGGYDQVVPRLGIVHHLNEQIGIKLLYGQAFRAPYIVEREIDVAIANLSIKGNRDLDPELVTTWDLQIFYNKKGLSASAALFKNIQEDIIIREVVSPSELQFVNTGKLTIEGLEIESKYALNNWYLSGSFTFQRNEDSKGVKDTSLQPDRIFKIGLGYSDTHFSFGIFDTFMSAYQDNIVNNPSRQLVNPSSEPFHRLSANLSYHPKSFNGWVVEGYFDNLLNEDIHLPLIASEPPQFNTRPALAGQFFMLTVTKSF